MYQHVLESVQDFHNFGCIVRRKGANVTAGVILEVYYYIQQAGLQEKKQQKKKT